jgi:Amt family ammonium transporter
MSTQAYNITLSPGLDIIYSSPDGKQSSYSKGDIAFQLATTALVLLMTPGVGFFCALLSISARLVADGL